MTGFPTDQGNAAAAIPVWLAGATPHNIASNGNTLAKGVLDQPCHVVPIPAGGRYDGAKLGGGGSRWTV